MAKIIFTGDWHFGEAGDSVRHCSLLREFAGFMVNYANDNEIDMIVHTGDYFDCRDKVGVRTYQLGIETAEFIRNNFNGTFIVIAGNHDMFFKNSLEFTSVYGLKPYCDRLITENHLMTFDGVKLLFTPWICDAEHWDATVNQVIDDEVDYIFGHYEFSGFKMNENYVMEHGQSHRSLKSVKRVCTGHYHGRQVMDNVVYAGSPFPFDMNDANDNERGFAVLDTDTSEVSFVNWDKVKIVSVSYDEFLQQKDTYDSETTVRVVMDEGPESEQKLEEVREMLEGLGVAGYKLKYTGSATKALLESNVVVEEVDNIDEAVVNAIKSAPDVATIDKDLLVSLYRRSAERNVK